MKLTSILSLSLLVAGTSSVSAQTLKLHFADPSLAEKAIVKISGHDYDSEYNCEKSLPVALDANGDFTATGFNPEGRPFVQGWINVDRHDYGFIAEPGKTLTVNVGKSGDDGVEFTSTGETAKETALFNDLNRAFDYSVYYDFTDTVPEQRQARLPLLDANHKEMKEKIGSYNGNPVFKEWILKINDNSKTYFQLNIAREGAESAALPTELTDAIDINDPVALYSSLPEYLISSLIPMEKWQDASDWGKTYLGLVKEKVTNPIVRNSLIEGCVRQAMYSRNHSDIDGYMTQLASMVGEDSPLVKDNLSKAAAIKLTQVGNPAPDLEFTDREGNLYRLSDFKGKTLFVDCWATWCKPCVEEIPYMKQRYEEKFKDDDRVVFISLSIDEDIERWKKFVDKKDLPWGQYVATAQGNKDIDDKYGVEGIPYFFVVNADGTIGCNEASRPSFPDFNDFLESIISAQK